MPRKKRNPKLHDRDWLYRQYVQRERPLADIAHEIGVTPQAVQQAMIREDIPRRGLSQYLQLRDRDWLYHEYVERGRVAEDIAAEVGCTHRTVLVALRREGIPVRAPRTPGVRRYDAG